MNEKDDDDDDDKVENENGIRRSVQRTSERKKN